jgi:hypothetical protein
MMAEKSRVIKRTAECASRENRDYKGPLTRCDAVAVGEGCRDGNGVTKSTKPVRHLLKAGDGTSIITEEDTTERSESGLERGTSG